MTDQTKQETEQKWYRILPSTEGDHDAILTRTINHDELKLSLHTEMCADYAISFPVSALEAVNGFFSGFESAEQAVDMFTQAAEEQHKANLQKPRSKPLIRGVKH